MDYTINYSKIKHWYVRVLTDWKLKLSIPVRLKNDKNFENILLEKWKKLLEKISKKNYLEVKCYGNDFVMIFWEKQKIEWIINDKLLKQKLYEISLPMLEKYSKHLWIPFQKLSIKSIKSKRGSCSHHQNIVLNMKLLHIPLKFLEYVIIHEACHLKEKNHSKKFWKLVEVYCPEYKIIRKELKSYRI